MKNIVLVLISVICFQAVSAQDEGFRIGFKVNPNVSWMQPDSKEITGNGTVPRFGFGLNMDILFTTNYAFGTGINITRTGGELVYLESSEKNSVPIILERTREYRLQYAEIPVTIKMRTNEMGKITYWGQFGLGLGFNVKAKGNDQVDYLLEQNALGGWDPSEIDSYMEDDVDIKEDINIFRSSMIIGLGIEYNVSGTTSILGGVTFNNGFSNVLTSEGVKTDTDDSPIFDSGSPVEYKLKATVSFIELNIGVLF